MRPLKIRRSYEVGFSPDGRSCFSLARDVSLWDIRARKKSWRSHPFSHPSHAAFSPQGDLLAVKSTSGRIVILSADTGLVLRDFKNQKEGEGSNLLFSTCGKLIVDGSWAGVLTVRDAMSGEIHFQRRHDGEMIHRVHSQQNGTSWIVVHKSKAKANEGTIADDYFTVTAWPFTGEDPVALGIRFLSVRESAVTMDGSRLAVLLSADTDQLRVYDLPFETTLWKATVPIAGSGLDLKWSACGRFLASVQRNCIVHYSGETGERLREFPLPYPSGMDYSPCSRFIALGCWQSGEIRALDDE